MSTSSTPRRRGSERTLELLDVTLALAEEVGYRGLTVEAIARRAGVGKHTIYRRWPTIADLLLDALNHVWSSELDYRSQGAIRADLREQFLRSSYALSHAPLGPIYRAVIAAAQSDESLRAAIHSRFLKTVEESTLERISLAQQQGQLKSDADLAAVVEVLVGSLYYRWLLTDRAIDEGAVDGLIGMFMDAYGESGV